MKYKWRQNSLEFDSGLRTGNAHCAANGSRKADQKSFIILSKTNEQTQMHAIHLRYLMRS